MRRNPLSPATYLLRNGSKTGPLVAVIVLSVLLIGGIVAMMNSIPKSITMIYRYSRHFLGVTPRGDASLTPELKRRIEAGSPVPIERIVVCRGSIRRVRSIAGNWDFAVLALGDDDLRYYVRRLGGTLRWGRWPTQGEPEAIVSEPVARNLGLGLGDVLLGPDMPQDFSPLPVRVVGIVDTDEWLMAATIEYYRRHHFPPIDLLLVFAPTLEEQDRLYAWAKEEFRGERAQLVAFPQLEQDTREMFKILYRILDVVVALLVVVITVMMALLMNIYQGQRVQEYGLLQALGYARRQILRRTLLEAVIVVVGGWILGVLVAFGLLNVVYAVLMHPRAFALDVADPVAFRYTLPVPLAILAASWGTVFLRFRRFDPVGVIERRLV